MEVEEFGIDNMMPSTGSCVTKAGWESPKKKLDPYYVVPSNQRMPGEPRKKVIIRGRSKNDAGVFGGRVLFDPYASKRRRFNLGPSVGRINSTTTSDAQCGELAKH